MQSLLRSLQSETSFQTSLLSPHLSQVLDLHCGLMALPACSYFLSFILHKHFPCKFFACLILLWHLLLRGPELIQRPIPNAWSFLSLEAWSCQWKSIKLTHLFYDLNSNSHKTLFVNIITYSMSFSILNNINLIVYGLSCSSQVDIVSLELMCFSLSLSLSGMKNKSKRDFNITQAAS